MNVLYEKLFWVILELYNRGLLVIRSRFLWRKKLSLVGEAIKRKKKEDLNFRVLQHSQFSVHISMCYFP